MMRLGVLALSRPRVTLAIWAVVTVVLAIEGLSFAGRISQSSIDVPGTRSEAAQKVAARYFGVEASIPILLQGPRAAVDAQGRRLVSQLRRDPAYRVLSPWDQGQTIPELRPRADAALVLVVARAKTTFAGTTGKAVRAATDRLTRPPVRAAVTGFSTVGADLKDETLTAAHDAERLAIPVLLLVLLLVFRSPIAALIPALFGLAAVESGYGAVGLIATAHPISDVATALTSMMGLALGIDYSLLLVSRFREELGHGADARAAAAAAQASAGRTVVFAGVTLVVAMGVAIVLSPGDYLLSAAVSVATVAVISVAGSFLAAPALLCLLGHRVNWWRVGGAPRAGGGWAKMAMTVQRRPVLLGGLALLPLLALAVPALGLDTGPPDVRALPEHSRARRDAEQTARVLGAGWSAPFEVFLADPSGPVTTGPRLAAMQRWQRRVARLPDVATVIGPGAITSREPALLHADRSIDATRRSLMRGRRDARRLSVGLADARDGVGRLRGGLRDARSAADQLRGGAGHGGRGARRLAVALARARAGARKIRDAIARAHEGARRLTASLAQARSGSRQLTDGLTQARGGSARLTRGAQQLADGLNDGHRQLDQLHNAARDADTDAAALLKALNRMTLGKADPQYLKAIQAAGKLSAFHTGKDPRTGTQIDPDYPGLSGALDQAAGRMGQAAGAAAQLRDGARRLSSGLRDLAAGSRRLTSGLGDLNTGARQLSFGLAQLSAATAQLPDGLGRLAAGADRLAAGLSRLQDGTGRLADGLASGTTKTATLQNGLSDARRQSAIAARDSADTSQLQRLQDRSPRLLDSGYFVLAALDGSSPAARTQAAYGVNLDRGGQAARITVIPNSGPNDQATRRLREQLEGQLPALAATTRAEANLGGVAAQITDYQHVLGARLPTLILALSVVTLVMLIAILRAIVLPIISVALNLLTVGASFGVVALLYQGSQPVMGGPGWADILSLLGTFTVVFGLSLDYQVFILTRMREAYQHSGRLDSAITHAIDRTGRVVTGAAAIMSGVFIAFSTASLTIITQSGVSLAAAVIIDATLVRMVLLPAVMTLAGPATFWMPAWLDRLLPNLDVEGPTTPTGAPQPA